MTGEGDVRVVRKPDRDFVETRTGGRWVRIPDRLLGLKTNRNEANLEREAEDAREGLVAK